MMHRSAAPATPSAEPHSEVHVASRSRRHARSPPRGRLVRATRTPHGVPAPAQSAAATPGPAGPTTRYPPAGLRTFSGGERRSTGPSARGRHATRAARDGYGQNFARVVGWTLLGTLLPGTGLIAAGRRTGGLVAVTSASLLVSIAVTFVVVGDPSPCSAWVGQPDRFLVLAAVLVTVVLLWAAMVIGTHSRAAPLRPPGRRQRVISALLVTSLIALVGGARRPRPPATP